MQPQPRQAPQHSEQHVEDEVTSFHSKVEVEQGQGAISSAQGSFGGTTAVLASSAKSTDAQQSGPPGGQSGLDNYGDLLTVKSVLLDTSSSLRNVIVEAALVSTCPDGFLGVRARQGSFKASAASLDPAVDLFLARFPTSFKQSVDLQPPENLVRLCKCLWMCPSAANGWIALSTKPRSALFLFHITSALMAVMVVILFGIGHLTSSWQPFLGTVVVVLTTDYIVLHFFFWRYGPKFASTKMYWATFIIWIGLIACLSCLAFLGPKEALPFGNQMTNSLLHGATIFFANVAFKLGFLPWEMPVEPMPDFRIVFVDAAIRSVRLLDSLTDLTLVRLLLRAQVKHRPFL
jgi:hypothetical protein